GMVTAPVGLILSIGEAMPFCARAGEAAKAANAAAQKTVLAEAIIVEIPYAPFGLLPQALARIGGKSTRSRKEKGPPRRAAPVRSDCLGFPQIQHRGLEHRPGVADVIDPAGIVVVLETLVVFVG